MARNTVADRITKGVLAREEVVAYLNGSHGASGEQAEQRVHEYLDELRTRQRHAIYRVLKHPLYPIFRKIDRQPEHIDRVRKATAKHRVVYVSNHRSHIDYLIEPLVLEDSDIRPPVIAAGINLFGGPLGFIHKHVTGAIPIRRNVKDPGYLITLKAYIAEILGRHDLMFYIEGGRSYSGELKTPKTGLVNAALSAELPDLVFVPVRDRLRSGPRGLHPRAPEGEAAPAPVHPRTRRDGALRRRLPLARVCHLRRADCGHRHRPARAARRAGTGAPHPRLDRPADEGAADDGDGHRHAAVDGAGGARVAKWPRWSTRFRLPAPTWRSTDPRQIVDEASRLFDARGIVVEEDGRFRVRERMVLKYYARAIEHLLPVPASRTH